MDSTEEEHDRSEVLQVRMTEKEKRTLRIKAAESGMSMSDYVRATVCQDGDGEPVPA